MKSSKVVKSNRVRVELSTTQISRVTVGLAKCGFRGKILVIHTQEFIFDQDRDFSMLNQHNLEFNLNIQDSKQPMKTTRKR